MMGEENYKDISEVLMGMEVLYHMIKIGERSDEFTEGAFNGITVSFQMLYQYLILNGIEFSLPQRDEVFRRVQSYLDYAEASTLIDMPTVTPKHEES